MLQSWFIKIGTAVVAFAIAVLYFVGLGKKAERLKAAESRLKESDSRLASLKKREEDRHENSKISDADTLDESIDRL